MKDNGIQNLKYFSTCGTEDEDLDGKTIKMCFFNLKRDHAVLIFTDDTYCAFKCCDNFGDHEIVVCETDISIEVKLEMGFMTQKEYDIILEREEWKKKRAARSDDLREFLRLKSKLKIGDDQ